MAKIADCFMCQDPMFTEVGSRHPQKIAELGVCTAILNRDWQFFRGSTILVFQDHVTELHHLSPELQHQLMDDASRMAKALEKTFPDCKLNHGLFGNTMPHLHWHIMVRREADPNPQTTIWEAPFPTLKLSDDEFKATASDILRNL
jgi:diadenosine tetraphosphate (Ap4A) HIT family hydrolase